jgi:N-glycosylase/DNA lyase
MRIYELKALYQKLKKEINTRLEEFRLKGETGNDPAIFAELAFCLLTPQTKARVCWPVICTLSENGLLYCGSPDKMKKYMRTVRFYNNKSRYIEEARRTFTENGHLKTRKMLFSLEGPLKMRGWLVKNIKGLGLKEAGHFLRNIGFGDDLAILDRHILKNLCLLKVIDKIPDNLNEKRYLEIEKKMRRFCRKIKIPMDHLDIVLWYRETRDIFK